MKMATHLNRRFIWCLHCEMANRRDAWVENDEYCPEEGCDGSFLDGWNWDDLRKKHSDYPVIPIGGKKYPLYG